MNEFEGGNFEQEVEAAVDTLFPAKVEDEHILPEDRERYLEVYKKMLDAEIYRYLEGRKRENKEIDNAQIDHIMDIVKRYAKARVRAERERKVDELTGLLKKSAMADFYKDAIAERKPGTVTVAIAFDIDFFKQINDDIGHPKANEILIAMGEAALSAMRPEDMAARFGGDEFMLLLKDVPEDIDISSIIARIAGAIHQVTWGEDKTPLSISAGAVVIENDMAPFFEDVDKLSDSAANVSKIRGRGRLTIARPGEDAFNVGQLTPNDDLDGFTYERGADSLGSFAEIRLLPEYSEYTVRTANQRLLEKIEPYIGDRDPGTLTLAEIAKFLHQAETAEAANDTNAKAA